MPQHIDAAISYLLPTNEVPRSYAFEPPAGTPWENCAYVEQVVPIRDHRAANPSIDREGFELRRVPALSIDFDDDDAIRSTCYAQTAELALAVTGAQRAHVFDHLVRRRRAGGNLNFGRRTRGERARPNGRIHNDYTEASGRRRLGLVIDDAEALAAVRRYAIVNIWRSISGPVRDTPLAVCDARTVMARDLVAGEVLYPKRTGEIYYLLHSPLHRWHYFPEMDRDEALVFKQYDSQLSGVSRFTLHAAFDLPEIPADAIPRESIELRCLVIYE
jgi:hypothetical protein